MAFPVLQHHSSVLVHLFIWSENLHHLALEVITVCNIILILRKTLTALSCPITKNVSFMDYQEWSTVLILAGQGSWKCTGKY